MMYDHIGLVTNNLEASIDFYEVVLETLGYKLCWQDTSCAGFGPKDTPEFWLYAGENKGIASVHIAFCANDHSMVEAFYMAGIDAGGQDNGPPGLRIEYSPRYYAAFLLDLDGNNIEAVCLT